MMNYMQAIAATRERQRNIEAEATRLIEALEMAVPWPADAAFSDVQEHVDALREALKEI